MAAVSAPVTAALVAAVAPRPEDLLLDLAGGTGDLAAAFAGSVAKVIETDFSPAMVDAARRRGLEGVEHRVMDMQELDLEDASVDAVVCRYGLMLVPDPVRALQGVRRVLKPGGRLAFSTWASARHNPWATAYGPVLVERGLQEPPQPGEPGQFALGEPDIVEPLVRKAGFEEVTTREVALEFRFDGWEDYRRHITKLAASLRETLTELADDERAAVDEAARRRLRRFESGAGYRIPGVALVTRAV